ncbi:MAG: efflux RND transporter permease subunit, partial [Cyanobacteria bacterium P01_F01_bin.86]
LDISTLSRTAKDLQDRLEAVPNLREVNLSGDREEVVQVQLIPSRLTTLGISSTQVRDAIQGGNRDASWDRVRDDAIGAQVRLFGRFRTIRDLKALPVARLTDNRIVRFDEVAEVRRDLERATNRATLSWESDPYEPAVLLEVVKAAGSDSIEVVNSALEVLEEAKTNPRLWPSGMEYRVLSNDADIIQKDQLNLFSNVGQASLLVFVILLVALTWREALIAGLAIPLTFIGALFFLWLGGQTLNTMVLIGMILALGLLVDVFILMLEGMHEGIFVEGLSFPESALKTVKSYAAPAFAGQLTTILALAPLMAISGTLGKFIRLIPISAITCLVLSYVLSLLVVIPLSKLLLGNVKGGSQKTFMDRMTEVASTRFAEWSLRFTVSNRWVARLWSLATVGLFVFSSILFTTLPPNLFPISDETKLSINVQLAPSATLARSQDVADQMGELLRQYEDSDGQPIFKTITKLVGKTSGLVTSSELRPASADYFIGFSAIFVDREQRQRQSYEYIRDLRRDLQENILRDYPGATLTMQYPISGGGDDPIQVEISGDDMQDLREISVQVQQALREIPGTMDVRDDLGNLREDYKLIPKREALNFYGLTQEDLAAQGRYLMIDNDIGDFPIGSGEEDIEILMSTLWPSRQGEVGGPSRQDEFQSIRFITPEGNTVPAEVVLEPSPDAVPLSITHRNGQRTVTVLAKTVPGAGVYDANVLEALTPKLEKLKESWPQGYNYRFGGDAETSDETFGSAGQMLVVAIFLVFAVLVLQFGSYSQPFIIILTIPFALTGTFIGFYLLGLPFSFPAAIGVIALTGIVVNDAIVMVETMNERRKEGLSVRQAAARGASDRLRPILTTSITTIIGLIPLALSEANWFPLCMAIIFGLIAATLIALLVVPGLYLQLTPNK